MYKPKPFVKWAGGKRQIIEELIKRVPEEFNSYYEPFIGGGALFFELMPKKAHINDYNRELINVYQVLTDLEKYKQMCRRLNSYEKNNNEDKYYEIRNKDKRESAFTRWKDFNKAARTIYLNKACFNGLYRVNSKNQFNVPYNQKDKINTYEPENLFAIHSYLTQNEITITCGDFEDAVKDAKKGDFVYFDPPYDVIGNSFTTYTEIGFGKEQQVRLANVYKALDKRGVKVMLSNHNTPLIQELYKDFNIQVIKAKRHINAKGDGRGHVEEVIVTNY